MSRKAGLLWAMAAASLFFGSACAVDEERKEVVIVGANHMHSADVLSIKVIGRVEENGQKIGVTAKFSETEPRLERLSIVTPDGKTVEVPPSGFGKVEYPQEESLTLGYIMARDSNAVGGIVVFLDFGEPHKRADLRCGHDVGDPSYETYSVFYDIRRRTFTSAFKDPCGQTIE